MSTIEGTACEEVGKATTPNVGVGILQPWGLREYLNHSYFIEI